jgi:hypothetical protein
LQREKEGEDSESDYFPEQTGSHQQVNEVTPSQATTQPFEFQLSEDLSQTIAITASAVPISVSRKRSGASVRQQSSSVVWVMHRSACPKAINVHFNAVDRGLCAQTLREHHTILERAMGRLYPRFKWGRSHYLPVQPLFFPLKSSHGIYIVTILQSHIGNGW